MKRLYSRTRLMTRLDQKHVGYERRRGRGLECLDRGERLGLTAHPPPASPISEPETGCASLAYHQPLVSVHWRLVTTGGGGVLVLYARPRPRTGATSRTPDPGAERAAEAPDLPRLSVKLHCSSNEVVRVKLQSYIFSLHFILIEKRHT